MIMEKEDDNRLFREMDLLKESLAKKEAEIENLKTYNLLMKKL